MQASAMDSPFAHLGAQLAAPPAVFDPVMHDPTNVYITGLDGTMTKEQLEHLFSVYGRVLDAKLLLDLRSGQPRSGLVRFETHEQAGAAIQALQIRYIVRFAENAAHRQARVARGRGRARGGRAFGGRGHPGGLFYPPHSSAMPLGPPAYHPGLPPGLPPAAADAAAAAAAAASSPQLRHPPTVPLYVANLGPDTDDAYLWNLFSPFGALHSVRVMRDMADPTGAQCRGIGFVNFYRFEDANAAVGALHNYMGNAGKPLVVALKGPKPDGRRLF